MNLKNERFPPIWCPLSLLIVFAIPAYVLYRNWGWWHDSGGSTDYVLLWLPLLIGFMATFMGFGVVTGIAHGISDFISYMSTREYRVCWRAKMISLRGSDGVAGSIHGGIFMVSGSVGSEQFYHYYTVSDDGSFQPHKWRVDSNVRVFEEDRADGKIVQWDQHFVHDWVYWFASPGNTLKMDFYIPTGSLKQSFALQ